MILSLGAPGFAEFKAGVLFEIEIDGPIAGKDKQTVTPIVLQKFRIGTEIQVFGFNRTRCNKSEIP